MIICNSVEAAAALGLCPTERQLAPLWDEEVSMTATVLGFDARAGAPLGFASGPVRATLRLEGAAAFATVAALYLHAGFSWPLFALLFLAPDLSMLGYLIGPRAGAAVYNVAHTTALALPLALAGFLAGEPAVLAVALIWIAHIGFDRALGYGLKYPSGFGDTHLGRIGRR
jgi:hypothetical protein